MTVNVGEIRLFAGEREPAGWMFCDGRALDTGTYSQLFTAIGRSYGSTGPLSFNLPDLRSRVPIHRSAAYVLGSTGGAETVTLTVAQIAAHNHTLSGTDTTATQVSPADNLPAQTLRFDGYQASVPGPQQMGISSISASGSDAPHTNLQPFLCINFIIAVVPSNAPLPRPAPRVNVVLRRAGPGGAKGADSKPAAAAQPGVKAKPGANATAATKAAAKAKSGATAKAKPMAKAKAGAKAKARSKSKPAAKTRPAAKSKAAAKSKTRSRATMPKARKTTHAASVRAKPSRKAKRPTASKRSTAAKATPKKNAGKAKTAKRSASRTAARRARR